MSSARPARLRVLEVGPLPPPVGGMATVVNNLREALSTWADVRVLNNTKMTAIDRPLWQGIAAQLKLIAVLIRHCLTWRPHVVHIHTCSGPTFWRNALDVIVSKLLGRRVMLHIHGAQFHNFLNQLSPRRAAIARRVFRACDRVLVLGEGWRRVLSLWCEPPRVVVVPNGVVARPLRSAMRGGPYTIVCLANYERRKGQSDLLQAVARLRQGGHDVCLALLGFESQRGYQQELLEQAKALGILECVTVPGPVVGDAKEAWLQRASCFCLPSYDEGLPMAMLEAMVLGLPVVVTRVGSIPEAVAEATEGLLFEPGAIDSLADHLRALLEDPARAAAIGIAGRARVLRDFTLEASARCLHSICRQLAGLDTCA